MLLPPQPSLTVLPPAARLDRQDECASVSVGGGAPIIQVSTKKVRFCFSDSHVFCVRSRPIVLTSPVTAAHGRFRRQLPHVGHLRVALFQLFSEHLHVLSTGDNCSSPPSQHNRLPCHARWNCDRTNVNADDTWDNFWMRLGPKMSRVMRSSVCHVTGAGAENACCVVYELTHQSNTTPRLVRSDYTAFEASLDPLRKLVTRTLQFLYNHQVIHRVSLVRTGSLLSTYFLQPAV